MGQRVVRFAKVSSWLRLSHCLAGRLMWLLACARGCPRGLWDFVPCAGIAPAFAIQGSYSVWFRHSISSHPCFCPL